MSDNKKHLYVMQCKNYVKFGISKYPEERIKTLQTGNPFKIYLLLKMKYEDSYRIENKIHKYFFEDKERKDREEKERKDREEYEKKLRIAREEKERIENELRIKKEEEENRRREEKQRIENELKKEDHEKVKDLINDLIVIKNKYSFMSKSNKEMFSKIVSELDLIIKSLRK